MIIQIYDMNTLTNKNDSEIIKILYKFIRNFDVKYQLLKIHDNHDELFYHQILINFYINKLHLDLVKYLFEKEYNIKIKSIMLKKNTEKDSGYIIDMIIADNTENNIIEYIYKECTFENDNIIYRSNIANKIINIYSNRVFYKNKVIFNINLNIIYDFMIYNFINNNFDTLKMILQSLVKNKINKYISKTCICRTKNNIEITYDFYNKKDIKKINDCLEIYNNEYGLIIR